MKTRKTGRCVNREVRRIQSECSVKRGKGKFLYSAVSNPQDCSKRFTLYFPGSPIQS